MVVPKSLKPNYRHSVINIPASILSYAGVRNTYPKSSVLQKALRKKYKNIVFILFDGLGKSIVNKVLDKGDIMRASIKETLHSVFPPTTTASTTTYITCTYPSEHGWLGWNMYFDSIGQVVDLFTNRESFTQSYLQDYDIREEIPIDTIFHKIDEKGKYKVTTIYPDSIKGMYKRNLSYRSLKEMFSKINKVISSDDKNFVFCYNTSPDDIMHENGPYSTESATFVKEVNAKIEEMAKNMEDTLIIICADHGQVEIKNRIYLHKYPDIVDMLEVPPYIDLRAVAFKVKEGQKVAFYKLFKKYFGNEFELHTKEYIQKKKYFGTKSDIVDKYIGDFVAIAYGESIMQYTPRDDGHLFNFKGHHAGLTREEVEVPLILIGKK